MKDITIKIELANAILNYLASKPYAEVAQLIGAIQEAAGQQSQDLPPPKE